MQAIPFVIAAAIGAGAGALLAPKNKPLPAQTAAPLPTRNHAMSDALNSDTEFRRRLGNRATMLTGANGAEAPSPGAKALLGQ
jgi:hypothetical protein